jgi:hypothetical protein
MTAGPRDNLRTEAALDAEDLVAALRRLRPAWIRSVPRRLAQVRETEACWTKVLPRRVEYDPDEVGRSFAAHDQAYGDSRTIDALVMLQRAEQTRVRRHLARLNLMDLWALPAGDPRAPELLGLPESGRVEEWRFAGSSEYWRDLSVSPTYGGVSDGPTRQWLTELIHMSTWIGFGETGAPSIPSGSST